MIVPIPYVHCGIGLLTSVLSFPLILRKIPMNRWYGIRVQKAFVSPRNWYEINARGGWLLLAFGVYLLGFGWFSRGVAPPPTSLWAPIFFAVPLLAVIPILALIKAFARGLPER